MGNESTGECQNGSALRPAAQRGVQPSLLALELELICAVKKYLRALDDVEVKADAVLQALVELVNAGRPDKVAGALSEVLTQLLRGRLKKSPDPPEPHDTKRLLEKLARHGVQSPALERMSNGSAEVLIEGCKPFRVPKHVADLLAVLIEDRGCGKDGLAAWRPVEEVMAELGIRKRHAFDTMVYRLRQEIQKADGNPYWIQRNARRDIRIAVRRDRPADAPRS